MGRIREAYDWVKDNKIRTTTVAGMAVGVSVALYGAMENVRVGYSAFERGNHREIHLTKQDLVEIGANNLVYFGGMGFLALSLGGFLLDSSRRIDQRGSNLGGKLDPLNYDQGSPRL